ncbi:hypothetical protein MRB53_040507 [Persea americana]|nr:hypothetical protein MRB53_040507 [Persea americana]
MEWGDLYEEWGLIVGMASGGMFLGGHVLFDDKQLGGSTITLIRISHRRRFRSRLYAVHSHFKMRTAPPHLNLARGLSGLGKRGMADRVDGDIQRGEARPGAARRGGRRDRGARVCPRRGGRGERDGRGVRGLEGGRGAGRGRLAGGDWRRWDEDGEVGLDGGAFVVEDPLGSGDWGGHGDGDRRTGEWRCGLSGDARQWFRERLA